MARMAACRLMRTTGAMTGQSFSQISNARHSISNPFSSIPSSSGNPLLNADSGRGMHSFMSSFRVILKPKAEVVPPSLFSHNSSLTAPFSSFLRKNESTQHAFSAAVASGRGLSASAVMSRVATGAVTHAALPLAAAGKATQLSARQCFASGGSLCRLPSSTAAGGAGSNAARGFQSHFAKAVALGACSVRAKGASLLALLHPPTAACEDVYVSVPKLEVVEESSEWAEARRWLRRAWVPIVFLVWLVFGMNHPRLLIANLVVIAWATKPYEESLGPWLEERRLQHVLEREGLDQLKSQINPLTRIAKLEVEDYFFFQWATASYLHEKLTLVGALGDWWILSKANASILGLQPLPRQS